MWVQNALLGYFCALILKNYFNIWFQHPGIFQIAKFCANWICHNAKQTKSNVVPKCLIWVFLSFNFRKLFPYLVSATWNLSKRKVLWKKKKKKSLKLVKKIPDLSIFELYLWKYFCHMWNQHTQFFQKQILNQYSEFWYIVRFFQSFMVLLFLKAWVQV